MGGIGIAVIVVALGMLFARTAHGATTLKQYYGHPAVEDENGVIAPWYPRLRGDTGQNGQLDFRVRVSAETLKRYPWVNTDKAVMAAPHFVYTSMWHIDADGTIGTPPLENWACGDLGQRTVSLINGMADYYRYSGDPAALAFIVLQADYIVNFALTPPDNPWPNFPISVPTKGKPYGKCDPDGFIQLDLSADIGTAILRVYQITGDARYFDAAKGWGDLLAAHCDRRSGIPAASCDESGKDAASTLGKAPWPRYANPEQVKWSNELTGSITMILRFLDQLIRLGYSGKDGAIVQARDAGRAYLDDVLLPRWTAPDTWGRCYWDWECPVLSLVNDWAMDYVMDRREAFKHWKTDARNVLTLILNRASVDPASAAEAYSGAWAMPESPSCCGTSLSYGQQLTAAGLAQYAALTGDPWAREMARRMAILGTYDVLENGTVIDGLMGAPIVAASWLNIIHPLALRNTLQTMGWLPDLFGPNRENHIMRASAEVVNVIYEKGRVEYDTFDAPEETVDVLRLAFPPTKVIADDKELAKRDELGGNGYSVAPLSNSDCIVAVRHDGLLTVVVEGDDPQMVIDDTQMTAVGKWVTAAWGIKGRTLPEEIHRRNTYLDKKHNFISIHTPHGGAWCESDEAADALSCSFSGNQVRITGDVVPGGGLADVYIDGERQRAGIDCSNPKWRGCQILFSRSGLKNAPHELKIVVRGEGNLLSKGKRVTIDSVQYSSATGDAGCGSGGGPKDAQRMVFGYTGREDLRDASDHLWRPATEWILRLGTGKDSVGAAWWTTPVKEPIENTDSPDLYRYGVHAPEFTVNVTVAPGKYTAKLKFAATRGFDTAKNRVTVFINGDRMIDKFDIAEKAGGANRAVDLAFEHLVPRNGVIEFRFVGGDKEANVSGEAFVQALEVAWETRVQKEDTPTSGRSR